MSVFDDVPAEDDAFSQAAGAMYEQQFTDDDFNALVERVSTGDVDPHNPLHAVLREVRYQLRAQPPVQIGTELGEFIGVGPASDARYTDFERPGLALVKYEPTIALDGTVNEIILEPLPEPASRLQRSGMMLAAAALVAVAMIAGAGISRSLNPTDSIPIDVEAPAVFGNEGPGANVPAATAVVAPVADESPESESDTLADTAEIVEPEPAVEDAPVEADEVNIALVSSDDEVTSIDTVDASQDDGSAEDADLANPGARDTRNVAPEPTIAPPTVVPPTATPEPTPVPAEPAPQVVPVIVAPTATPIPAPTSTAVPTATATPRPTATNTPVPTATSTPTPAPTSTAVPTATATPRPTATNTPVPTATSTPPTSTPVPPPPAATSTPVPPPTPIGD